MQITVAGEKKTYDDGLTVKQLIDAENLDNPLYVTVSINDEFVRNNAFDTTVLKDGDVVEFMYFMGGGAR
jgi:sulfur carrier protein